MARSDPYLIVLGLLSGIALSSLCQNSMLSLRNDLHCRVAKTCMQATVGAGLPIINTLQAMLLTGDRIHRIEGVFSGSLSFIFNTFGATQPFSAAVAAARDKGFTEPDPREDLSGAQ